ncbi:MAG: OmpA family protein [Alphaproteobacteria bacterium]
MRRILLLSLLLAALAACTEPRQALVVVLPNPDGSSGAVTVTEGDKSVLLDQPYAASEVRGGAVAAVKLQSEQVQQIFGQALAARPILPSQFMLYFVSDSDQLTPESQRQYRAVFEDIKRRPAYEVEVVGHTDTLGDKTYNQQLSLQRARAIRDQLVRDGLDARAISTAGRGELDLAVQTGDQVSEPRNRRTVITVR